MENASKALIIAGAILISILLISVGIIVMNSINDPIDQAGDQARAQAIEMFNSKFTGYAGVQKASAVKALMTSVISSNGTNVDHPITVTLGGASSTPGSVQSNLNSQRSYRIEFGNDTSGYINSVAVTEE